MKGPHGKHLLERVELEAALSWAYLSTTTQMHKAPMALCFSRMQGGFVIQTPDMSLRSAELTD